MQGGRDKLSARADDLLRAAPAEAGAALEAFLADGGRAADLAAVATSPERVAQALTLLLQERSRLTSRAQDLELRMVRLLADAGQRDRDLEKAVTELRQSTEDLVHAQKLELVGRLVGGIAHDFNNLLSVIVNYAHFVEEAVGEGPIADDVREVSHAAERAADLTRRLLLFVRRDEEDIDVLDLSVEVLQLERLLTRLVGETIRLTIDVPAGAEVLIEIDRSRLEQVLTNLVVNARDAITTTGSIAVTVRQQLRDGQQWAELLVVDDGAGMDPAALRQATQPFFSTKTRVAGTGLGLATVASVVEQAAGQLHLDSAPGQGTTVRLLLPVSTRQVSDRPERVRGPGPSGSGRIVLVEDDPAVLRLADRVLTKAGYDVVACSDAHSALAAVDGWTRAVLTDLVLPDLRGIALAARLHETFPGLPILLITGYADELTTDLPLLRKPFTGQALLGVVAELVALP